MVHVGYYGYIAYILHCLCFCFRVQSYKKYVRQHHFNDNYFLFIISKALILLSDNHVVLAEQARMDHIEKCPDSQPRDLSALKPMLFFCAFFFFFYFCVSGSCRVNLRLELSRPMNNIPYLPTPLNPVFHPTDGAKIEHRK